MTERKWPNVPPETKMKEERHKRPADWSPGDIFYSTRLKAQKGGFGGWVYLTGEHIAEAMKGPGQPPNAVDVDSLLATRTVLDPGTGQILIRLKAAKKAQK